MTRITPSIITRALCTLLLLAVTTQVTHAKTKADPAIDALHKRLTVLEGSTPAQWRLTWKNAPYSEATISWTTVDKAGEHIVYYDTESRGDDLSTYASKQSCQRNGMYKGSDNAPKKQAEKKGPSLVAYYHHCHLTGLKENTTYYVRLVSNGVASREFHFITAPKDATKMVFLFGGDSRSGISARSLVNNMIAESVTKSPEISALIHGGDYIGSGKSWSQWRMWLSQHELTTTAAGRLVPIIPAKGNHDGGILIAQVFDFDQKKPIYYYNTAFGPLIALVTLDTNIAATGPQETYIQETLPALRPNHKWLLVQYHRPIYPAVKSLSGAAAFRKAFAPVFDKANVDLALESDGHCIKRTVPIRADKQDPTGTVYIGEGGMGVGQRTPKPEDPDRWYINPKNGGMASKGHHLTRLDIDQKSLRMRVIRLGGEIADDHTLTAR